MAMKKIALTISSILLCVFLAIAILAGMLLTCSIAYAQDSQDVLYAPVSNLEGNAYAGKSSLSISNREDTFCIPESYYVTDIKENVAPGYYTVSYCGFEFAYYLPNSTPPKQTVTLEDGVSPYPDITLHVASGGALLLSSTTITEEYTIKFLGYSLDDTDKIYVVATYNGESVFGFARTDVFESFTVPYHPIAEAERNRILESKLPPEPEEGDIVPNTSLALRIVLIIGIAIPAVVIVILLFKPSKNDRRSDKNQLRKSKGRNEFDYDSSRAYNQNNGYDDRRPDERYDNRYDPRYDSRYDGGYDNRYDRGNQGADYPDNSR